MKKRFRITQGRGHRRFQFPLPGVRSGQALFTDSFYKFLFGFSIIILASFGVLFYLSTKSEPVEHHEPTSQLAQ